VHLSTSKHDVKRASRRRPHQPEELPCHSYENNFELASLNTNEYFTQIKSQFVPKLIQHFHNAYVVFIAILHSIRREPVH